MTSTTLTRTSVLTSARVGRLALRLAAVVALAGVVALSAQVRLPLPFTPIPVTLQTGAVLLSGALLGPWLGLAATALYLAAGWLGLPVLTGATLFGATGGYLLGFLPAAFVMGLCCRRGGWAWQLTGAVLATAAIYGLGTAWLCALTGQSVSVALSLAVVPFIGGDALKAAAALALARLGRPATLRLL